MDVSSIDHNIEHYKANIELWTAQIKLYAAQIKIQQSVFNDKLVAFDKGCIASMKESPSNYIARAKREVEILTEDFLKRHSL